MHPTSAYVQNIRTELSVDVTAAAQTSRHYPSPHDFPSYAGYAERLFLAQITSGQTALPSGATLAPVHYGGGKMAVAYFDDSHLLGPYDLQRRGIEVDPTDPKPRFRHLPLHPLTAEQERALIAAGCRQIDRVIN
jgi:hypothetical protein